MSCVALATQKSKTSCALRQLHFQCIAKCSCLRQADKWKFFTPLVSLFVVKYILCSHAKY